MSALGEALRTAIWAQALGAEELARVEAEMSERAVPAGGYVCRKGEPVNHWIGIIDGLVKLGTVSAEGKPATLAGVPAGGCSAKARSSRTSRAATTLSRCAPLSCGCSIRASRSTASFSTS
jgi:CRP-like cAMP-binding protein